MSRTVLISQIECCIENLKIITEERVIIANLFDQLARHFEVLSKVFGDDPSDGERLPKYCKKYIDYVIDYSSFQEDVTKASVFKYTNALNIITEERVFKANLFEQLARHFEVLSKVVGDDPSDGERLLEYCKMYIDYVIGYSCFQEDVTEADYKARVFKYTNALNVLCDVEYLKSRLLENVMGVITDVVFDQSVSETCILELMRFFNNVARKCNETVCEKVGRDFNFTIYAIIDTLNVCESYEYQTIALETVFLVCSKRIAEMSTSMFPGKKSLQAAITAFDFGEFTKSSRRFLYIMNILYGHIFSIVADSALFEHCSDISKLRVFDHPLWVDFNKKSLGINCDWNLFENSQTLKVAEIVEPQLITVFYSNILMIDSISLITGQTQFRFNLNGQLHIKCASSTIITEFKVICLTFTDANDIKKMNEKIIPFINRCKAAENRKYSLHCRKEQCHYLCDSPVTFFSAKTSTVASLHNFFDVEYTDKKHIKESEEKSFLSLNHSSKTLIFNKNDSYYLLRRNGSENATSIASSIHSSSTFTVRNKLIAENQNNPAVGIAFQNEEGPEIKEVSNNNENLTFMEYQNVNETIDDVTGSEQPSGALVFRDFGETNETDKKKSRKSKKLKETFEKLEETSEGQALRSKGEDAEYFTIMNYQNVEAMDDDSDCEISSTYDPIDNTNVYLIKNKFEKQTEQINQWSLQTVEIDMDKSNKDKDIFNLEPQRIEILQFKHFVKHNQNSMNAQQNDNNSNTDSEIGFLKDVKEIEDMDKKKAINKSKNLKEETYEKLEASLDAEFDITQEIVKSDENLTFMKYRNVKQTINDVIDSEHSLKSDDDAISIDMQWFISTVDSSSVYLVPEQLDRSMENSVSQITQKAILKNIDKNVPKTDDKTKPTLEFSVKFAENFFEQRIAKNVSNKIAEKSANKLLNKENEDSDINRDIFGHKSGRNQEREIFEYKDFVVDRNLNQNNINTQQNDNNAYTEISNEIAEKSANKPLNKVTQDSGVNRDIFDDKSGGNREREIFEYKDFFVDRNLNQNNINTQQNDNNADTEISNEIAEKSANKPLNKESQDSGVNRDIFDDKSGGNQEREIFEYKDFVVEEIVDRNVNQNNINTQQNDNNANTQSEVDLIFKDFKEIEDTDKTKKINKSKNLKGNTYKKLQGDFDAENDKTQEIIKVSVGEEIIVKDLTQSKIASRQQETNLKLVNNSQEPIQTYLGNDISIWRARKSELKAITLIEPFSEYNEVTTKSNSETAEKKNKYLVNLTRFKEEKEFSSSSNTLTEPKESDKKKLRKSKKFKEAVNRKLEVASDCEVEKIQDLIATSTDGGVVDKDLNRNRTASKQKIDLNADAPISKDEENIVDQEYEIVFSDSDQTATENTKKKRKRTKKNEENLMELIKEQLALVEESGMCMNRNVRMFLLYLMSATSESRKPNKLEAVVDQPKATVNSMPSNPILRKKRKLFDTSVLKLPSFKKSSSKKLKVNEDRHEVEMKLIPVREEGKQDTSNKAKTELTQQSASNCDLIESFRKEEVDAQTIQEVMLSPLVPHEKKLNKSELHDISKFKYHEKEPIPPAVEEMEIEYVSDEKQNTSNKMKTELTQQSASGCDLFESSYKEKVDDQTVQKVFTIQEENEKLLSPLTPHDEKPQKSELHDVPEFKYPEKQKSPKVADLRKSMCAQLSSSVECELSNVSSTVEKTATQEDIHTNISTLEEPILQTKVSPQRQSNISIQVNTEHPVTHSELGVRNIEIAKNFKPPIVCNQTRNKQFKDASGRVKSGRVTKRKGDKKKKPNPLSSVPFHINDIREFLQFCGNRRKKLNQKSHNEINNNPVTVNNGRERMNLSLKLSKWQESNLSLMDRQYYDCLDSILEKLSDLKSILDFGNLPMLQKYKPIINQFKIDITKFKNL